MPSFSLRTRISLVITGLTAGFLLILAALWLQGARNGIHEEVAAASRVSEQWLLTMVRELETVPAAALPGRVLALVRPLGRIRANALEVFDGDGRLLYRSPPPTYKAGRQVPTAFAALVQPTFSPRSVRVGILRLVLTPDPSRAVIDAWDDLGAMAGWAAGLLAFLFLVVRRAVECALRPLGQVMAALERIGHGRFDTRLPAFKEGELRSLSRAFNGMADRLAEAVAENVGLEREQEITRCLQVRLEGERRGIARELHDELAQGITAVRALAGAIVQRSEAHAAIQSHALSIVAVTGEMQDGVRIILQRLRPAAGELGVALEHYIAAWRQQHPEIQLVATVSCGSETIAQPIAQTILRIVQEGFTNIVRHAGASRVDLAVIRDKEVFSISLADNGCGLAGSSNQRGCGFGLAGMGERITLLGGSLEFISPLGGGFELLACLPERNIHPPSKETA